ncbi:DUF6624 domain-containing protein [Streptomyces sp. NPDC058000]|uniref:DUF6624 domain-containing protein n=1 Tax=Streptomyces sp. NPDC058000 TaxID=3346299 RepID=UPI0036F15C37
MIGDRCARNARERRSTFLQRTLNASIHQTGEYEDLARIDAENTSWIKTITIIAERGWPGTALVGEQGADEAWLLVQHADLDPDFQHQALQQLKAAAEAGDARLTLGCALICWRRLN